MARRRVTNIFVHVPAQHVGLSAVRGQEYGREKIGNGACFSRASV